MADMDQATAALAAASLTDDASRGAASASANANANANAPLTAEERAVRLRELFEAFATFGQSRASSSNLTAEPLMDGARWQKFFKDQNLLDANVTQTTLDLHFAKAKSTYKRSDRKLPYDAFLYALKLAAVSKYGSAMSDDDALDTLVAEACAANGPIARGTVAEAHGIYAKLTDPSTYTGQHKDKPTGSGNPGSTTVVESSLVKSKSKSQGSLLGSRGNLNGSGSRKSSNSQTNLASLDKPPTVRSTGAAKPAATGSRSSLTAGTGPGRTGASRSSGTALNAGSGASATASIGSLSITKPVVPAGSVFDRLTSHKGYTGTHKERFDDQGRGKGKAGRVQDDVGVKSMEQLVGRK